MKASKRIREIAKRAYEQLLEKEFHRECFVDMVTARYNQYIWEGMIYSPTEEEAHQALDLLERSGRIMLDVRDIHTGENWNGFWVVRYYPNTCTEIKKYKRSKEYKQYLAKKKYGYIPRIERESFYDPETAAKIAAQIAAAEHDRVAFAASHPSRGAMKAPMPDKCPICFADLTKTTCVHSWDEMLEHLKFIL